MNKQLYIEKVPSSPTFLTTKRQHFGLLAHRSNADTRPPTFRSNMLTLSPRSPVHWTIRTTRLRVFVRESVQRRVSDEVHVLAFLRAEVKCSFDFLRRKHFSINIK